jgi:SAM-dependent methyltransferase
VVAMMQADGKEVVMESDRLAERARRRALVRCGYDAILLAYHSDDGDAAASSADDVSRYVSWVAELAGLLRPGARVVDLGCGAGIPATRELARHGLQVLGVDFSAVQLHRAQRLVPAARFVQADMAALHLRAGKRRRRGDLLLPDPPSARGPAGIVPAYPRLAWSGRLFPGHRRSRAVDRHRALSRCRYVLRPRRHRDLTAPAAGSRAGAHLEPLHPGRKQRAYPRPGRAS